MGRSSESTQPDEGDAKTGGYRSAALKRPVDGVLVLSANDRMPSRSRRLVSAALDISALPVVALGKRRSVSFARWQAPLDYGFSRWAWRTERCVEIGIASQAVAAWPRDDVLEVGNVLPFAGIEGHTVVDKYEQGPGVLNEDIVTFSPGRRFGLVVSVSTLEHVGWDEDPQDPDKAWTALLAMSRLVAQPGALLVSIPVGYSPGLEDAFISEAAPFDSVSLLVKTSRLARWEERPLEARASARYGAPYTCGNAILVGVSGDPFSGPLSRT
jgi:hypothetical protein